MIDYVSTVEGAINALNIALQAGAVLQDRTNHSVDVNLANALHNEVFLQLQNLQS